MANKTVSASNYMGGKGGGPGSRFAEGEKPNDLLGTLKRIFSYFKSEKMLLIALVVTVVLATVCGLVIPSVQSKAIDIIAGARTGNLIRTLGLMLAVCIVCSFLNFLQEYLCGHLSQRMVRKMRDELFGKIIDLPIKYLDNHSHGDVMSRMSNDADAVSSTVSQALPSLFSGVLTIIGTFAIMLWYCWQLALISCVSVVLTLLLSKIVSEKMHAYSKEKSELLGELNANVEETVSGYRTVVAYNHQNAAIDELFATSDKYTKAGIMFGSLGGAFGPMMNCIGNLGFVLICIFGGYFAINGIISVGVISAFIVYAKQFSRPINQLAQIYSQLQSAVAGAERVFAILDENEEDMEGGDLVDVGGDGTATIRFKNVDFSYVPEKKVIKNFSLDVPAGKKVALVGSTGCGKTTIVNLLMKFYEPDSGDIFVDGQNIKEISRSNLRKNIAIVLQDTVLFTDTVGNNLKYGRADATGEDVMNAARMSRCMSMIRALPQKFDTVLTGAGASISQGQRQLLAIARAFVAKPLILILDEATSNVDTRTEKLIQAAMQRIMKDRTSVVIAHRLSTIRDADIIIVMDAGEIAEKGTHEELLEKKGKYYDLYMTQYAGFAT